MVVKIENIYIKINNQPTKNKTQNKQKIPPPPPPAWLIPLCAQKSWHHPYLGERIPLNNHVLMAHTGHISGLIAMASFTWI